MKYTKKISIRCTGSYQGPGMTGVYDQLIFGHELHVVDYETMSRIESRIIEMIEEEVKRGTVKEVGKSHVPKTTV